MLARRQQGSVAAILLYTEQVTVGIGVHNCTTGEPGETTARSRPGGDLVGARGIAGGGHPKIGGRRALNSSQGLAIPRHVESRSGSPSDRW